MAYGDGLVISFGIVFQVFSFLLAGGQWAFLLDFLDFITCFLCLVALFGRGMRSASGHHFKLAI